jgi:hypothetical protein
MDAVTPRGRAALQSAADGLAAIERQRPQLKFSAFSDESPASVDGMIVERGVITGIYEVKARDMSLDQLTNQFKWEWLVSYEKIHKAFLMTQMLRVRFVGVLVLIPSRLVLAKTIIDSSGAFTAKVRIEQTNTQKTVNGGAISRPNAFIEMRGAAQFSF